MISVLKVGGLGDYLWQYCFARLMSERFGCALKAPPARGFPGTWDRVQGAEIFGPDVRWDGQWPYEAYSGRKLEAAELWSAPASRLIFSGWFQRFEFFADERDRLQHEFLRYESLPKARPAGDLAIALRIDPH